MNKYSFYKEMFIAVQEGSILSIQECAYKFFKFPIAICDTSFQMLAPDYPNELQNDDIWDIPNKTSRVPYEFIKLFHDHNLIEDVNKNPNKTIYINTGWFKERPRITTGIFINNELVGYIAVLLDTKPYPKHFDEWLQIVSDAFSIILKQERLRTYKNLSKKEYIANELFSSNLTDLQVKDSIKERLIPIRSYYQVIATNLLSNYQSDFKSLINKIENFNILYSVKDNTLLILTASDNEFSNDHLYQILINNNYRCGVSSNFTNLSNINKYIFQANNTLKLAYQYNNQNIYYFEDYALDILIYLIHNKDYLLNPSLDILENFDSINNTEYYETLKVYINNPSNIKECLKQLHIHRNTLNYRLNKIAEITNINYSNQYELTHIYISFLIKERSNTK